MDRPIGRRWRWIVTAAAGGLSALAGLTGIREFDQWHHMAWGRAFLQAGFPAHDFFLFTYQNQPAPPAHEWLGSVFIYLSWLVGGEPGTVLVVGLLFGLTIALLVRDALDDGEATWTHAAIALLVAALAVGVIRRRAVGRPEIFCYPMLAWTLHAARRWVEGRGRAILAFPILALVWSNVHVTVLYGLGAVFLIALEAGATSWRSSPGAPERGRARTLALVALAGTALALLHPGGSPLLLGIRYGLGMLGIDVGPSLGADVQKGMDLAHGVILELQPPTLDFYASSVGALIVLTVLGFLAAWRRVRVAEVVLAGAAMLFAARAVRFMPLFAIVASAACARNLGAAAAWLKGRWRAALWILPPLVPAAAAWSLVVGPFPLSLSPMEEIFPARAAQVLAAARAGEIPGLRIFDTFHFGGYLEWALGAPVIYNDGRLLWPAEDAETAIQAAGSHDISRLDFRWRFDALVVDSLRFDDPKARRSIQDLTWDLMADRRTFALVALDDGAYLYVRRDGKLSWLALHEYRAVSPVRALTPTEFDDPLFVRDYRREMTRAVADNPACVWCKAGLYFGHLAAGDPDAAERLFPDGTIPPSEHPLGNGALDALVASLGSLAQSRTVEGMARYGGGDLGGAERLLRIASLAARNSRALALLGRIRAQRGDMPLAEKNFQEAIRLEPTLADARLDLATLFELTGRPAEARDALRAVVEMAPATAQGRSARARLDRLERGAR